MYKIYILLLFSLFACTNQSNSQINKRKNDSNNIDCNANTLSKRILAPKGYSWKNEAIGGFGDYLKRMKVLPCGERVHLYNGELKWNQEVHAAIIDISVGKRDLQQCADAVMRLRAEYLYKEKQYDKISFNFTNGWQADYKTWRAGNRIVVNGNKTYWSPTDNDHSTRASFDRYLQEVFIYAGTYSLSKELKQQTLNDIKTGDVFIKGGFPGHAVIVVGLAENEEGDKMVLLAQSYMPAQQIHVLKNPNNDNLSPWYMVNDMHNGLATPEWSFTVDQLKLF